MSKGTILLTGATGFVCSAILLGALRDGFRVRVVARSADKAAGIRDSAALTSLTTEEQARCEYIVVPDLTVLGALDGAAAGADFVIHGASPLPFTIQDMPPEQQWNELVEPAIGCTLAALESARCAGTVRRVVCLSSVGAFASPEIIAGSRVPPEGDLTVIDASTMNPYLEPPFASNLVAYCASKTAALRRSIEWMQEAAEAGGPGFDLVNIAPTYIGGRQPLARTTVELMQTSNAMVLRSVVGTQGSEAPEVSGLTHIDDVVRIHLTALDMEKIPTPSSGPSKGIENFPFGCDILWQDINGFVAKTWPDEVARGLLPNQGHFVGKPRVHFDRSKVEQAFGFKLKRTEEILPDIVTQYLELQKAERT